MRRRTAAIGVVCAALTLGTSAVALADGGVGATSAPLGAGLASHEIEVSGQEGTDVVMVQNTFAVGGTSGWHSHPGDVVVVVQSGQITIYSEHTSGGKCRVQTHSAGEAFVEKPWDSQAAVNHGTTPAVVSVTFFGVQHGGSSRIDRTPPTNCSTTQVPPPPSDDDD